MKKITIFFGVCVGTVYVGARSCVCVCMSVRIGKVCYLCVIARNRASLRKLVPSNARYQ